MTVRSNEFKSSPIDNNVRPYNIGLRNHNETLATILVYKESSESSIEDNENIDYLSDLSKEIIAPSISYSLESGTPGEQTGTITKESLDEKNEYYGIFNNFSLLNVSESHEQIVKLHVNFGADWNAFFFGEQPRVYQFSGFFLDAINYPYYQEFMVAYDKYLSGRKSIEKKLRTKFIYDGKIVDGYMLNITTAHTAANQLIKNFQFTVLVKGLNWARMNVNVYSGNDEFNTLINKHRLVKEKLTNSTDSLE